MVVSLKPTIVAFDGPVPLLLVRDMISPIVPETNSAPTASIEFSIVGADTSGTLLVEDESPSKVEGGVVAVVLGCDGSLVVVVVVLLDKGRFAEEAVTLLLLLSEISIIGSSLFVTSSRYHRETDLILANLG